MWGVCEEFFNFLRALLPFINEVSGDYPDNYAAPHIRKFGFSVCRVRFR